MKEIVKLGLILLIICGVSAALLGYTNEITIGKILEQREFQNQAARKEVLSSAEEFKPLDEETLNKMIEANPRIMEIYIGYAGGSEVGYVIKTAPNGFSGAVEVITGIETDGNISGVRIGNHAETPGLGANATLPEFYGQYDGKSADRGVTVVKTPPAEDQIQAISGATITSKAVTTGVTYAIEAFKELN